jgi:hypothetical protein
LDAYRFLRNFDGDFEKLFEEDLKET